MKPAFSAYPWPDMDGAINAFMLDRQFPSTLFVWADLLRLEDMIDAHATHYGYVVKDTTLVVSLPEYKYSKGRPDTKAYRLKAGMYFSVAGTFTLHEGKGIVIAREGYRGTFMIGGPVEPVGRLRYIDGCTDSLLIPPVMKGDPCLNALYFPPGIDQTAHTHPSDRIGMVASGRGRCIYDRGDGEDETIDLVPGMVFCIHTDGRHKFATPYGEAMRVIAYHPDSDQGPTHEAHPMLSRTIVDGVSAMHRPELHTKS